MKYFLGLATGTGRLCCLTNFRTSFLQRVNTEWRLLLFSRPLESSSESNARSLAFLRPASPILYLRNLFIFKKIGWWLSGERERWSCLQCYAQDHRFSLGKDRVKEESTEDIAQPMSVKVRSPSIMSLRQVDVLVVPYELPVVNSGCFWQPFPQVIPISTR